MDNVVDVDEEGNQQKLSANSTPYQTQECVLYGSIFVKNVPDLERRLAGLWIRAAKNSMSTKCRSALEPPVHQILRRRFRTEHQIQNYWQLKYIGVPEPDQKCPTIVRKEISSLVHSQDMMTYAKSLGLRMDYEYITQGKLWTKGNIKILHSTLTRTLRAGTYDSSSLKSMSDSALVEISISLPESAEYMPAAKSLRDFADQLMPLVNMEKIDYWKKMFSTPAAPARR
ncbi:Protein CBR-MDT-18 [Caenorhabditis briggsae]|uniref:Mediator of RNA polymerase II transcription subunit 18 n=1 Tax=Caenorhabditis briggsae TaxID=6238 RepID=MED18_CAEBR|nr:Protein CBR-MDT-18 [Caenorhabditis briggsae]Q61D43.1 RecName: Full=Mediator of RNA polymerase II transcription subunit 18; AltName: Full=Mediator complex subunit 18 [Caenorhabditis briggsae]CAP31590.1 Protein CBR-MDT-18 [Caenorhabditis briggsae]